MKKLIQNNNKLSPQTILQIMMMKTCAVVGGGGVLAQVEPPTNRRRLVSKTSLFNEYKSSEFIFDHFKELNESISSPDKPTWQGLFDNTLGWYFFETRQKSAWQVLHNTLRGTLNDAEYAHARTDEHVRQTWTHMTGSDKKGFYNKIKSGLSFDDGKLEQLTRYFKNLQVELTGAETDWTYLFDNEISWYYYCKSNTGSSWGDILESLGLQCPETWQDIRDIWDEMELEDKNGFFQDTVVLGLGSKDVPM